ncbi:30S ribosomal protein S18 [Candidatus Curtissbacteria bacterium]|nr:30S ribosomal protein S18 [Candidatus Curtissbacteria bacterium]
MSRKLPRGKNCQLCANNILVDYKDVNLLSRHISERGKILSRAKTGVCARHQRQLTRAIKRARFVALLPFAQK